MSTREDLGIELVEERIWRALILAGAMRRTGLVLVAVAALLVSVDATPAADAPWLVGVAKVDITPPAFDATADAAFFAAVDPVVDAACPRALFDGPREGEQPAITAARAMAARSTGGSRELPGSAPLTARASAVAAPTTRGARRSGWSATWRDPLTLVFRQPAIAVPFAPPATVTLTDGDVDRIGSLAACSQRRTGLRCASR